MLKEYVFAIVVVVMKTLFVIAATVIVAKKIAPTVIVVIVNVGVFVKIFKIIKIYFKKIFFI